MLLAQLGGAHAHVAEVDMFIHIPYVRYMISKHESVTQLIVISNLVATFDEFLNRLGT